MGRTGCSCLEFGVRTLWPESLRLTLEERRGGLSALCDCSSFDILDIPQFFEPENRLTPINKG